MRSSFLFTSESVSEGHPDKVADQISDAVLDAILTHDKRARVACETMVKTGAAIVAGAAPSTRTLEPGHARPVTTGAPVPPGTTSVVRSAKPAIW